MFSPSLALRSLRLLAVLLTTFAGLSRAQVVINEIHYHPIEKARFNAAGVPIFGDTNLPADLTDDVHEFVELHNAGASAVTLSGWKLAGVVDFVFPGSATIPANGFLVVAKNVARLQVVYALTGVLGPFSGKLKNSGDTVRLLDAAGATVDSVSYEVNFPWPITANALGAEDEFTGFDSQAYQYKGRSLQRVSAVSNSNDPANWVAVRPANGAVTFADRPTPGLANIISRPAPAPIVTAQFASQLSDGAAIIRANQQVKITCTFSSTVGLSGVQVDYYLENINAFNETRTSLAMTDLGGGQFTATLPARSDRSLVRYRIRANRGDGLELVAPRVDDPALVQVGPPTYLTNPSRRVPAPREAWFTYFVTPVRNSLKPIYDVFVSANGAGETFFNGVNGLQALAFACNGDPKRATSVDTNGLPRETPFVPATDRLWNDTVPGVFVHNGVVRDIQIRYHGSRYNRTPTRRSFKVFFPDYLPFTDGAGNPVTSIFETDKNDFFMTAHGLYQHARLPLSSVRYVDWYFNTEGGIPRLEQGEYNGELLEAYHEKTQRLNPGSAKEATGEYYKSVGFIISPNTAGEGPYGSGNGWKLPASGRWTELQRFDYTFGLQNHLWKGAAPIRDLINGLWTARGDTYTSPNPNIANTKAWFNANWDVDTELTSLALGNWMCPWDDTTQNHFLWRRASGKWVRLLWDFDAMYGTGDSTSSSSSIFLGEVNDPNNNSRGPNYVKDSFIKAFRAEYRQRLWFLNNTLLDPENLQTLTYLNSSGQSATYLSFINAQAGGFASARFTSVNSQVGLGLFYKPNRPTGTAPSPAAAVLPGASFTASPYASSSAVTHAVPATPSPHTSSRWEIRAANGNYDDPICLATLSAPNLTSLPIPFGQLTYGQTYLWRVTYIDALGRPSITSAERSFSYGPTSSTAGNLVLNEVLADNRAAVANGGKYPDYVELKNNTAADLTITGWRLTDNELQPNKYTFPTGTVVPANGYLIVWCDSDFSAPGLHSGFGLSSDGQRVILIQSGTVRDAITFGPQATDAPIGRVANGTGAWTLVAPTPNAANVAGSFNASAASVKINEWLANPASGEDWFELFNADAAPVALGSLWLSDTPATPKITQIPALTFIGPKAFVKFVADGTKSGFNHVDFKLSTDGEAIVLSTSNGVNVLDSITFSAQPLGISSGRLPDGGAALFAFPQTASLGESNWLPAQIVINEALTNAAAPMEDAIELFNPGANAMDVSGWWLSDDKTNVQKFQIPAGTLITSGGFLVLCEDQFGAGANGFSLSASGDEITLSAADGDGNLTGYRAQVSFEGAAPGVPFGRVLTGNPAGSTASEFWPLLAPTFAHELATTLEQFRFGKGFSNAPPTTGPIIFNEVMYHPPDLAGADNARDEFIELHNITTTAQDVASWKVKGEVDFVFPAGATILPGDYVLLVSFNPATDATALSGFRAAYGIGAEVALHGPFSPKLSNGSALLELVRPGAPISGETPLVLVDRVRFFDGAPWPTTPDGSGPALQRISRAMIGNDVANWLAAAATPGAVNAGQGAISDSDGDGLPDAWENARGLNRMSAADAPRDADSDGRSNLAEYFASTDPNDPASVFASAVTPVSGGFEIRFSAKAGRTYAVQFCEQLGSGAWMNVPNAGHLAPAADQTMTVTDTNVGTQRFYRVVTPAP